MRTGVIGTGAMGAGIATRLIDRGHEVHIRDIDPGRAQAMADIGARPHDSAAALIGQADLVFIVVVTADQIDQVLGGPQGLLAGLSVADAETKTIYLCSTIAPEDAARFARLLTGAGAGAVDAPISGGPARAYDGTMSIMLAAATTVLDEHAGVIDDIAQRQFRISANPGDGARAKLVNNLAAGVNLAVAAEALVFAERAGLDVVQMHKLMSASSGQSWAADDRMPRAFKDDNEVRAATRVLTKDLTLATAAARKVGASVPIGEQALVRFRDACDAGFSEKDDAAMLAYYRGLLEPKI